MQQSAVASGVCSATNRRGSPIASAAALVGGVALLLVAAMNGVAAAYGLARDTYVAAVVASGIGVVALSCPARDPSTCRIEPAFVPVV